MSLYGNSANLIPRLEFYNQNELYSKMYIVANINGMIMIVIIVMSDCQSKYMPMAGGCFAVSCSDNIYINELLSINIYANYWHLFLIYIY